MKKMFSCVLPVSEGATVLSLVGGIERGGCSIGICSRIKINVIIVCTVLKDKSTIERSISSFS